MNHFIELKKKKEFNNENYNQQIIINSFVVQFEIKSKKRRKNCAKKKFMLNM